MEKSRIKYLLRESLNFPVQEAAESEDEDKKDKSFDQLGPKGKKKVLNLTKKIKNATQPGSLLKLSQVMDSAGVGDSDSATDRSAIGKAVSGKPDADGNIRHLTVQQANSMGKIVDNPVAYK